MADISKTIQDSQKPQPVSMAMSKEQEMPAPDLQIQDMPEYQVPKEVAAHVQVIPAKPDIPPDLKQIGVTAAPSDQTISATNGVTKPVPLTDDQINDALKQPVTESIRWLAAWCVKQLQLMHVHLTKVKGRYIRVPEPA